MNTKCADKPSFGLVPTVRQGSRRAMLGWLIALGACTAPRPEAEVAAMPDAPEMEIFTLALPAGVAARSATYTPAGRVLVSYFDGTSKDLEMVRLATLNDDGSDFRPFFAGKVPLVPGHNGIRFMVFQDNRRVFLGDYVLECARSLDDCSSPELLPVEYPKEIASGPDITNRWSEIIIAPDNRTIAWTSLLANYSAVVFTGELSRSGDRYVIARPSIVSTLNPFRPDPAHADGVLPEPIRGGEVKQFVDGGLALSMAGMVQRDLPGSVVQDLATGTMTAISNPPAYTETTIFSPDQRLGLTMSTRFSRSSDPAILAIVPRPYAASLNIGLNMFAYTYSVTGVRRGRAGSIGPVLIDIAASRQNPDLPGIDLARDEQWVFHSPMSWHPSSQRAMWMEGRRGEPENERVRIVRLPRYRAGTGVPAATASGPPAGAITDLSVIHDYATRGREISVKVYGRHSGRIDYRRTNAGLIEKRYLNFSDDGKQRWNGFERSQANPRGFSTYEAQVTLDGPQPGKMDMRLKFGPLSGSKPAMLDFSPADDGRPASSGFAEFAGRRLQVQDLVP